MASRRAAARSNAGEVGKLIASLTLDERGAALSQIAFTLAVKLDEAKPSESAQIARQLTDVIERLTAGGGDDDDDDWTAPSPT